MTLQRCVESVDMHGILATPNGLPSRILETVKERPVVRRLPLHRVQQRLAGHDIRLQATGERLQAARGVRGVADHRKGGAALATHISHHGRAIVDADADANRRLPGHLALHIPLSHGFEHGLGASQALGRVL